MVRKRGVSPIIATVLLLVITVVLVGIIAGFLIPFVSNLIEGSGDCYDILNDLSFEDVGYTCYVEGTPGKSAFSVRINDDSIAGFQAVLYKEGSALPFEVTNSSSNPMIRMLGGTYGQPLSLPQKGGVLTYIANDAYTRIELYPILQNGNSCDQSDSIELIPCVDSDVIAELG